jgi:hypothetical protein
MCVTEKRKKKPSNEKKEKMRKKKKEKYQEFPKRFDLLQRFRQFLKSLLLKNW